MTKTATMPALDVEAVRRDFPILNRPLPKGMLPVYLDTGASAQKPQCVIDKEREVYECYYANAYRGVYKFGAQVDEELEATREKLRALVGAEQAEEIVYTSGTTAGINLVANAWGRKFLKPGDRILLTEMEHHANLVPWQFVAGQVGAELDFIPLTADRRLDMDRLDDVLTERTRMVALTGMSNVLGTIPPVREIADRAHARGALVLVDGAQSVPHAPTDVAALGADFLVFSGHKLYGPSGIGVLYGRMDLLEAMDPYQCGGHMIAQVFKDHTTWAEVPAKFEAGTLPIAQAIALGTAVDYVESLGWEAIQSHEHALLTYAHERLMEVPGMTIHGPAPEPRGHKGAICSFSVDRIHPEDLANLLDRRGVFVRHGHHCTMPLHQILGVPATTRASFGLYNTKGEVDALVDAIHFARQRLRLA